MRYYCKCFDDGGPAGFDASCLAIASIKVDEYGNDITPADWDYEVDTMDSEIPEWCTVTCGCCGEEAKILE